jgi:hypothetical protein
MNGNASDIHPAALEMDEKQHVVGHQPAQRQHLRGEEIGPCQQRQMDPNEGPPGCRALALWRGRQSVASQDIADGLIADLVSQIGQRPIEAMEAAFCVEMLEDAMVRHGKPEIFNTDQGSQFTGSAVTGVLATALRSAWTARAPGGTTSSSNGCWKSVQSSKQLLTHQGEPAQGRSWRCDGAAGRGVREPADRIGCDAIHNALGDFRQLAIRRGDPGHLCQVKF